MQEELFRFGAFELDPVAETLRRSGLTVRIPRQPLRVLLLLVRRAGEIVTRDDIHAAIWGSETYVDFEHGINSAIRLIRSALGDQAETPRYVRTLPRRGYQFVAAVERVVRESAAVAPPLPAPRRSRIPPRLAVGTATAILAITAMAALIAASRREEKPPARAIAVLPFRHLGPRVEGLDERAFAEELRARIGILSPAHVSLSLRAEADLEIHGTIREAEDGARVIVSAVDVPSQTQLWSETYQRPATRKEGMALEVAHRVTREIARRFLPAPRHEPLLETRARPSAVALYREARSFHVRMQMPDWIRAKELYAAALREEPRFAEAWSGMGDVWIQQLLRGPADGRNEAARQAAECARRALALQPRNAEAHSNLGLLAAQHQFDLIAAEESMRRAASVDPGYADARTNLATILTMRGLADESLREWEVARQLDPDLPLKPLEPFLYLQARRYEDARARYREILAVEPGSPPALWGLLFTAIAQKDWSEAIALARTFPPAAKLDADVPATESGFLELYGQFESFMQDARREETINDYFLAIYYAQLGRRDPAFALLNRAIDARLPVVSYMLVDPRIDNLREDPRFQMLLDRLKLGQLPV